MRCSGFFIVKDKIFCRIKDVYIKENECLSCNKCDVKYSNHKIEKKQDWSQDNTNPLDDLKNFEKKMRNITQKPFIIEPIVVGKKTLKLLKKMGIIK